MPGSSAPLAATQDGQAAEIESIVAGVGQRIAAQRLPIATYRMQFNRHFTFRQAQELVPYLAALGISDLYASPLLQAREGSLSGYDVVDYGAINSELGTRDELESLSRSLRGAQMGLILDVVPNHMGTGGGRNRWWQDVLENGPSSPYADYFDIDWMPLKPDLAHKILLPVLGDQYGKVLEDGQLSVRLDGGVLWLHCYDSRYPLAVGSYAAVLGALADPLAQQLGAENSELLEFLSILTAIRNLPPQTAATRPQVLEKHREQDVIKRRLKELLGRSPAIAAAIESGLSSLNGTRGDARSFDRLDALIREQSYRLAYWRVAADEINYRRFFDINELAAVKMEQREVFENSHGLVFELLDRDIVQGLRIDHPDGLFDPRGYLSQLQEKRFLQLARHQWESRQLATAAADAWPAMENRLHELFRLAKENLASPLARPLYVIVEKILGAGEPLPEDWPVHGTVGYKYLCALSGLFVAADAEQPLSAMYTRFSGESLDYRELAYRCKRLIVRMNMSSELAVLGHRLDRLSERNRWTQDFTLSSLTQALQEVIAVFSVYRSYVEEGRVGDGDRRYIESAVARAKRRNPAMSASIFDFVRDLLLLRYRENADEEERTAQRALVGKFQQLTGPIMAKAIEDTAFYRFNRLVSLNEVGGDPVRFGTSAAEFHKLNAERVQLFAHSLSASSTHDTKRSEDVRARINVLSEIPREWRQHVLRWARWNKRFRTDVEGQPAPSANDEYLLYQTLVGIWPDEIPAGAARQQLVERLQQYMLKVAREAKSHTSWISPHEPYEQALLQFVAAIFQAEKKRPFVANLHEFARLVADHGRWNSLSQLVLKIASPGAPDFYQGTELWSLTLVDPDNRQSVDFGLRQRLLADLQARDGAGSRAELLRELLEHRQDGRVKLFTTWQALLTRRKWPELFTAGEYLPLEVRGTHAERLIALARRRSGELAIAAVPRLTARVCGFGGPPPLAGAWGDTVVVLPPEIRGRSGLVDCFTQRQYSLATESLRAAELLEQFPAALLTTGGS